jgi:16S rRNA (uracil1498-N3)-methyltransferase
MTDRSLHRFFVDSATVAAEHIEIAGPQAHQLARVLRLRAGERIVVLDGSGEERVVELDLVTPARVRGAVLTTRTSAGEPRLPITLYQALVSRDKLEVVLQKGTEVGVSAFVPVRSERSLVGRGERIDERRLERWRRIVQEAAEQSRRGRVPEVRPPLRLTDALTVGVRSGPTLVAWEGERGRSVREVLRGLGSATDRLSLVVGPEGGFSDAEIGIAAEAGALTVSLGPRILRTETAGPVLAALALYEFGEMEVPCPGRSAS